MLLLITIFIITSFSFAENSSNTPINEENIESLLIGEWIYKYSINSKDSSQLKKKMFPTKRIFKKSTYKKRKKDFTNNVKKILDKNTLKNIYVQEYKKDKKTDTYYPAAFIHTNPKTKQTIISISNYGLKHKYYYAIYTLNKDSMVINKNHVYFKLNE